MNPSTARLVAVAVLATTVVGCGGTTHAPRVIAGIFLTPPAGLQRGSGPTRSPQPSEKVFSLVVTTTDCLIDGPPSLAVKEGSRTVVVLATFAGLSSGACAGGPPPSYTVLRLRAPLGRRALLDGGTVPPSPIRTPPGDVIAVPG